MWILMNKLFGYDYIAWSNTADTGVARIYKGYNKYPFYVRYKSIGAIDEVKKPNQVIWLTCRPDKYLEEKE